MWLEETQGRYSGVMDVPIILQEGVGIQVYRTVKMGTSLVVQWLRLPCFHCRGAQVPYLIQELRIPHAAEPKKLNCQNV